MKQMTPFPPEGVVSGATNPPNPDPSAIPSGNDDSGDLSGREEAAFALAQVLDPDAFASRTLPLREAAEVLHRQEVAVSVAMAAIDAGYRLVSEDDTTVDRIARAMHLAGCQCGMSFDDHQVSMLNDFGEEDEGYVVMARAAIRALREGGVA